MSIAWKVFVFGVILVRILTNLDWVSLRIQSECGKIPTRITPNMGTIYTVTVNILILMYKLQKQPPTLRHGCFPVTLLHIFRTRFPKNTFGRCFWTCPLNDLFYQQFETNFVQTLQMEVKSRELQIVKLLIQTFSILKRNLKGITNHIKVLGVLNHETYHFFLCH